MKSLKPLIAYVVILLAPLTALAQPSLDDVFPEYARELALPPLMMNDGQSNDQSNDRSNESVTSILAGPFYEQFGHPIYPGTFTFEDSINTGNQTALTRTVNKRQFGPWNSNDEDFSLHTNVVTGQDSFTVAMDYTGGWRLMVHYRYAADPDGNGPLNIGDDAVTPIELTNIDPMGDADLHFNELALNPNAANLHYQLEYLRYDAGQYYQGYVNKRLVGQTVGQVWAQTTQIDQAGFYTETLTDDVYMGNFPADTYCFEVTITYTHTHAGIHDFENVVIDQINNCSVEWNGIPTDVCEAAELAPCELRMFPNPANSMVTVEGFKPNVPIMIIITSNGQLVRPASTMPSGDQLVIDVSDLAAGAYSLQQEGAKGCQFVKE